MGSANTEPHTLKPSERAPGFNMSGDGRQGIMPCVDPQDKEWSTIGVGKLEGLQSRWSCGLSPLFRVPHFRLQIISKESLGPAQDTP